MRLHCSCAHIEIQGPIFLLLKVLKKVQKRQLSVQEPFLRCPQQPPITVLGRLMPFSSLHTQVERVHMCMHVHTENKPLKKEKKFSLMFTVDISISPQALRFLLYFEMLSSSAELGKLMSRHSVTFLSNSRAGIKSHRLSDVHAPR